MNDVVGVRVFERVTNLGGDRDHAREISWPSLGRKVVRSAAARSICACVPNAGTWAAVSRNRVTIHDTHALAATR